MNLILEGMKMEADPKATERARAAQKKKEFREPTWSEVWDTGYTTQTGTWKEPVFKNVIEGSLEWKRLVKVRSALQAGEIGLENPSLRRFSKAQALRLYKVLGAKAKEAEIAEMVSNTPGNYRLIQTVEALEILIADLKREPFIAFDTETTGVDVYNDELVGLSFTLPLADYHVYIPVGHNTTEPQLRLLQVINKLRNVLTCEIPRKVAHNAKFDIHILLRNGVHLGGLVHDTMIAMRVLNENEESVALKNLASKYGKSFGFVDRSRTYEELFGKVSFAEVPLDVALVYAAKDTHLTWELYRWQKEHLRRLPELDRLYREIENPLIDVCFEMEQTGFLIDADFAKEYGEELKAEIAGAG